MRYVNFEYGLISAIAASFIAAVTYLLSGISSYQITVLFVTAFVVGYVGMVVPRNG